MLIGILHLAHLTSSLPFEEQTDDQNYYCNERGELLVGWTLIGWVTAFVWALTRPAPAAPPG
jgi:hypothetical protein